MGFRVNIDRVIGAGLCAWFAADAAIIVEIHNAVRTRVQRLGWANLNARSMLTMITAHDWKHTARVRELPLFYILNPGPIDPNRNIMLCFTSNRAGVAADAVAIVDYESKIQIIFLIRVSE